MDYLAIKEQYTIVVKYNPLQDQGDNGVLNSDGMSYWFCMMGKKFCKNLLILNWYETILPATLPSR